MKNLMMNKKILMLGLIDPAKNDASKIHFYEIANSFVKLGHKITLLVPKNSIEQELICGMNVFKMPLKYSENFFVIFILSILQFVYYLFLSADNYDFVYIRWRLLPCFLFKFVNLLKRNQTQIITEHNGWIKLEAKIQHSNKIYSNIGYWLQVIDALFADKVIAVTQGIKNKLIQSKIKSEKIVVIGNGTNIRHFYPIKNRSDQKKTMLNINDKIILGFIGNISKWQGLDDLVIAFNELSKKYDNIVLLVIGSGIYLKELKSNISNMPCRTNIVFKENIDYNEINLWMNIIDIAFAPKSYKLNEIGYSPLKIRDYAACGKTIISTNVKGIRELAIHDWLYVYNSNKKNDLIDLIEKVLKTDFEKNSILARDYAEKHFKWETISQKIIDVANSKGVNSYDGS